MRPKTTHRSLARLAGTFFSKSSFVIGLMAVLTTVSSAKATDPFAPGKVETKILGVESSYPNGYRGNLIAVSDEATPEQVSGFKYTDSRGTERNHTADEIRTGIVLVHALGKDLLKLRGKDFERSSGGQISLMFYREFLGGDDRRELRFTYQPEGAEWVIRTDDQAGRDPFDHLAIKIKTGLFGTPTAISELKLFREGAQVRRYNPSDLPRASDRAFLFLD